MPAGELPSDVVPFDAASSVAVEDQKEAAMLNIQKCLRSGQAARALALLRASRSGKTHTSARYSVTVSFWTSRIRICTDPEPSINKKIFLKIMISSVKQKT